MSRTFQLASASESLTLHQLSIGGGPARLDQFHHFTPDGALKRGSGAKTGAPYSLASAAWAPNGAVVAAVSPKSTKVVLNYIKNQVTTATEVSTPLPSRSSPVCVSFRSGNSKQLVIGFVTAAGVSKVVIYDVATKVVAKEFELPEGETISCMACNYNDQYIAVGCLSGHVLLLNSLTLRVSAPLRPKNSNAHMQQISCVKYSSLRKWRLASACQDGSVAVWDTNKCEMTQLYPSAHSAPVTAVAFSPTAETLLVSAGLDKKVVCYDAEKGKVIEQGIRAQDPLTAIEMFPDGMHLGVGTSRGGIFVYNLKNLTSPVAETPASSSSASSIRAIACQPTALPSRASALRTTGSSKSKIVMKENIPAPVSAPTLDTTAPTINILTPDTPKPKDNSFNSQVFSPLRDIDQAGLSPAGSVNSAALTPGNRFQSPALSNTSIASSSLFSPLREQSFNSPVTRPSSGMSVGPSPLTIIREERDNRRASVISRVDDNEEEDELDDTMEETPKKSVVDKVASSSSLRRQIITSDPLPPPQPTPSTSSSTSGSFKQPLEVPSKPEQQTASTTMFNRESQYVASTPSPATTQLQTSSEIRALMTAFPKALLEQQRAEPPPTDVHVPDAGRDHEAGKGVKEAMTGFQQEFVRACVEESMEEFCAGMRMQLWHLHLDSIRTAQRQSDEIAATLQQHESVYERLAAENEKLRRENEQLRKYM